jgi:hypothetical protein
MKDKLESGKKEQFQQLLADMQNRYTVLRQHVSNREPGLEWTAKDCLLTYAARLWFDSVRESCIAYVDPVHLKEQILLHVHIPVPITDRSYNPPFDIYNHMEQNMWELTIATRLHPFLRVILRCIKDLKIPENKLYKFFDKDNRRCNLLEKIIACFSGFINANIFLTLETIQDKTPQSNIIVMAGFAHTKIVKKMLLNYGYKLVTPEHSKDPLSQEDFHTIFSIQNPQV